MASPTVYKWTDPGAPQMLRGSSVDMQAVFQAVLIDGYGSQTPPVAGLNKWTIPFSDGTGFVLKQGGTQPRKVCMKLDAFFSTGGYAEMECAVDYTALNTPQSIWAGTAVYDRVGVGYSSNATYNIPWVIIATERAMFCQFGYNNNQTDVATFDTAASATMYNHHWFFGDYAPEDVTLTVNQCVSFANYSSSSSQYFCESLTYTNSDNSYGKKRCAGQPGNIIGEYRCDPFFSRPIGRSTVSPGANFVTDESPRYPNLVNGGLYLDEVKILSERSIMGKFPGLLFPIQSRPFPINGIIHEIDGTGSYSGEKIYVFGTWGGQYMIRDGEWGVD